MTSDSLSSTEEKLSLDDFKVESFDNSELKQDHFQDDKDKIKNFVLFPLILYLLDIDESNKE